MTFLLDVSLLRRAKLENLERLAKALGVGLPTRRCDQVYASMVVSAIASFIRREAMVDEVKRWEALRS